MPSVQADTPANVRELHRALHLSQARNAAILRASLDAIVTVDHESKVVDFNAAAESLFGYSQAEAVGKDLSELIIPPQMRERHKQGLAHYLATGEGPILNKRLEMPARRADGTEFFCELTVTPIEGEGKPMFTGFMRDISEKKDSEEQMRLLLESTGEGIYGSDLQGRCTFINRAAAAMLGYVPAEIIGREMHALIHHHRPDRSPYPVEQCPIYRAMQNQSGVRVHDEVLWRKDGTSFAAEYSSFPVMKNEKILGAVVTFQDVTQTRQLEGQFRQSQKMEAVGRLAGGVAHDFNNLLTIISGYSHMLLAAVPAGDPTRDLLTEIKKAGERAASLTRQLLAFSRKQLLEFKVLDLNAVVTRNVKMVTHLVGEDVDLVTVLDPALSHVRTDPGQMEQVLMNLVVNARDAMPQGGKITIETTNVVLDETYCRLHPEVEPGFYIMLALSDTGCGMDEQTRARIFEPFFTTKEPDQGTGLGLAMIHGFIKQSGGHISVHSEPGVGSTFKIYFPEVEAVRTVDAAYQEIEKMPHGGETILLVEDEAAVRAITRYVLQTCGYIVLEAANGSEAIRLAEKHRSPIHLLLTDVVMPGMGGPQVAERVMTLKPGAKVLYTSGYTEEAVVRHGVLESRTAFLQKPFTPRALAVKVREVLDKPWPHV